MLEFAILGLLSSCPMHGYELRKRLSELLGPLRALSYGSLYPMLKKMTLKEYIEEVIDDRPLVLRRGKRVYRITEAGLEQFYTLRDQAHDSDCADERFGVHLAFFSQTPSGTRLRILQGRRRHLEQLRQSLLDVISMKASTFETYSQELRFLKLDATERELSWINSLIHKEDATKTPVPVPRGSPEKESLMQSIQQQRSPTTFSTAHHGAGDEGEK